jgi:hypothetical protein
MQAILPWLLLYQHPDVPSSQPSMEQGLDGHSHIFQDLSPLQHVALFQCQNESSH